MTDEIVLGPCMLALTDKRRKFVLEMLRNPLGNHTEWARDAGYSDKANGARVRGFEVYHDPKVQAAIGEVAKSTLGSLGPLLAVHAVLSMARNAEHPQHSRAVEMILNRTGFAEKQQIEVVHRDLTGDALIERVRMLEAKYGLDKTKLVAGPAVIDGECRELKRDAE